jgi:hypothetical protein
MGCFDDSQSTSVALLTLLALPRGGALPGNKKARPVNCRAIIQKYQNNSRKFWILSDQEREYTTETRIVL